MPDLSKNPTERDALAEAIIGRYPSFDPLSANGIGDAVLAAGFHRTPTPSEALTIHKDTGEWLSGGTIVGRQGAVIAASVLPGVTPEQVEAFYASVMNDSPTPHVEADGPEHGHTFEVSIRSRGSSTVIGSGVYRDANWWSQPMTVRVRAWDGPAALRAAAKVLLGEWDLPDEDAPEPPADDGYVSRNVYDYDEPEPPADVREALATLVQEQFPVAGGGYSVVWEDLFPVADAILAALPALGYVRITGDDDQVERVVTAMFNVVGDGSQMQSESHWYDIARTALTALRGGA